MTAIAVMQGVTHGLTVGCLKDRMNDRAKDQFTTLALQINHTLLTSAQTFSFLGSVAKATCALTPLAIVYDLSSKDGTFFSEKTANILNQVYVGSMIANAVALFILGNPIGAVATVAMIGINAVASGQIKDLLDRASNFAAMATLTIQGANSLAEKGVLSNLTSMSASLVGAKEILHFVKVKEESSKKIEVLAEKTIPQTEPEIVAPKNEEEWYSFLFKPIFPA